MAGPCLLQTAIIRHISTLCGCIFYRTKYKYVFSFIDKRLFGYNLLGLLGLSALLDKVAAESAWHAQAMKGFGEGREKPDGEGGRSPARVPLQNVEGLS